MRTVGMIIVPSYEADKRKRPAPTVDTSDSQDDPPPTYSALPSQGSVPSGTSSGSLVSAMQTAMKPSNYISISRSNASVKGAWLLDPTLAIPSMFLPPLSYEETEDTRRNLYLKSSNGSIDAEITLAPYTLGDNTAISPRRASICTRTVNGPIRVLLHTPYAPRLAFYLSVEASNGAAVLYLPRSFNGLISIRQLHGTMKFSHEVSAHLTTFSDVDRIYRCFIGDYSAIMEGQEWRGDEVVIDTRNGGVRIHYDDEIADREEQQPGFFGKIFRF